ncbi:GNAT family N-acetyltransferase [Microbacterium sp. X-17]|uniref:GNAT family N-acetyltransferase n=1 Tax=Microbacterium sp. X-17 TaxID=3144404 RepID=UPI0031F57F52
MPIDAEVVRVRADDPRARAVLADLEREYDERYGDAWGEPASAELDRYPIEEFAAPDGAFLVLVRDGEVVAGGAFRRFDASTSELKRIWTSAAHRRQGLARRIVAELEHESRRLGYGTVYLTTGPAQPEAHRLYLATGYTPLFDVALTPEEVVVHGFAKSLTEAPLDRERIQRGHDEALAEFFATLPDGGAGLRAPSPAEVAR